MSLHFLESRTIMDSASLSPNRTRSSTQTQRYYHSLKLDHRDDLPREA